jgi:hypothetical protein
MAKKATVLLALLLSAFLSFAEDRRGGLIEGDRWAFLVSAPDGWVWDSVSLRRQGIFGLFYKAGDKFSPSKLHMYISPTPKKPDGPATLIEFIQADEGAFMKSNHGSIVKDLAPYSPGIEYNFTLKDFDDRNEGFFQSLAYYEGEDVYLVFVLSCRSVQERERERASFLELLDSFTYIRKE